MTATQTTEARWMNRRVTTSYGGGSVVEIEIGEETGNVYLTVDHDDGTLAVYDADDLSRAI